MQKWIYLCLLAIALLTLAVGGWVFRAAKSVTRPARLAPQPA